MLCTYARVQRGQIAPGAKSKFCTLCSNLRPVRSKCTVLKKVFVALLGLFCGLRNHSALPSWFVAPGIVPLCLSSLHSYVCCHYTSSKSLTGFSTLRSAGQVRPVKPFHSAAKHILPIMKKYSIYEKCVDWAECSISRKTHIMQDVRPSNCCAIAYGYVVLS